MEERRAPRLFFSPPRPQHLLLVSVLEEEKEVHFWEGEGWDRILQGLALGCVCYRLACEREREREREREKERKREKERERERVERERERERERRARPTRDSMMIG